MVEILHSTAPVDYLEAKEFMEQRVQQIVTGLAEQCIWLLEHPPLYTAGTSASPQGLLDHSRFPVYAAGRGGQYTYHGPGQRVVYLMLNLAQQPCGKDLRKYICNLEKWLIATLSEFGVDSKVCQDRIGVWVDDPQSGSEEKIAAIGVRVRKWVSFHGIALNVKPNLEHFSGIVPCGISDHGVTSLEKLGSNAELETVDAALLRQLSNYFNL
jgi:lipoyl(octanoyl) transferase